MHVTKYDRYKNIFFTDTLLWYGLGNFSGIMLCILNINRWGGLITRSLSLK